MEHHAPYFYFERLVFNSARGTDNSLLNHYRSVFDKTIAPFEFDDCWERDDCWDEHDDHWDEHDDHWNDHDDHHGDRFDFWDELMKENQVCYSFSTV